MGLFDKKPAEPMYCGFCEKEIRGFRFLTDKTASGKNVCGSCMEKYRFYDLGKDFFKMSDEELEDFMTDVAENEERVQQFDGKLAFPEFKLSVDPIHQWMKGDNHHYVYDTTEVLAVVYSFILDGGYAKGNLLVYAINPYYPFLKFEGKVKLKGFLKSSQEKDFNEKLMNLSAALGDVPLLTPKEFKREHRKILLAAQEELLAEISLDDLEDMD